MLSTNCRTVCRYLLHPISSALVLQSICLLQRSLKGTHRSPQANWFGSHAERKYGKCYDPYKNRKNLPDSGWGRVVRIGNSQNWTENQPDSGWGRVFRIGNSQNWTQLWVRNTASMWRDCCWKKKLFFLWKHLFYYPYPWQMIKLSSPENYTFWIFVDIWLLSFFYFKASDLRYSII